MIRTEQFVRENLFKGKKMSNEKGRAEYTNTSRRIHLGPCVVKSVHIAGDGEAADAQVYDGQSAKDRKVAHLEVLQATSYTWTPGDGADFDNGIYIAVSGSGAKVTVTYTPESRSQKQ